MSEQHQQVHEEHVLSGIPFQHVKSDRRQPGRVFRAENYFARLGPEPFIGAQAVRAAELYQRGFPVPEVIDSGNHEGDWYFIETAFAGETFHVLFAEETERHGRIQDSTFQAYLDVIRRYMIAQTAPSNRTIVDPHDFVHQLIPQSQVFQAYERHGHDATLYDRAIQRAIQQLAAAPTGILQYDLNPFNILKQGVIDIELSGPGVIGYDSLTSARWGGSWYPDYPARYTTAYRLRPEQLQQNDALIDEVARSQGLPAPSRWLQEFLLLRSAWAVAYFDAYDPRPENDWSSDRRSFQHFRSNILKTSVQHYLAGQPIPYWSFPMTPGGELN